MQVQRQNFESRSVYLDNNATTAIDPRVLYVMTEALEKQFGNPSSAHAYGQAARQQVNYARRTIAAYFGVRPQEIVFTSGGTEGANTIIRGFCSEHPQKLILSSSVEHAAVYSTLRDLESKGQPITFLSPGAWGAVTPEAVQSALLPETGLICLMAVNNETGVKSDIEGIAAVAYKAKIPLMVDAVALLGKENIVLPQGVSAACFSGHKFHGPKGIGFMILRGGVRVPPLLTGGGQESGKRCGTENVAGILGMAEAIRLLESELPSAGQKMRQLRDKLQIGLFQRLKGLSLNGEGPRVANTLNISFEGVDGETLLIALDRAGVAVSHGSACASGALEPSRILLQMGLSEARARSAIRFSLSRFTSEEEVERALDIIVSVVNRLRK